MIDTTSTQHPAQTGPDRNERRYGVDDIHNSSPPVMISPGLPVDGMSGDISVHAASTSTFDANVPATNYQVIQDEPSSLLWPDSENFLQSILTLDPMAWDQSMTDHQQVTSVYDAMHIPTSLPNVFPHAYGLDRDNNDGNTEDYLPAAIDGRRAVQTVNGLVRRTLHSITGPLKLLDLTPRYLDSSLHMFFDKFVPIFPVIHQPTFVLRDCSAPVLLNAIAIGSLFLGKEESIEKGEILWQLAHTAMATSWTTMINQKREYDACAGVQLVLSSLLSQIYAALSRNRTMRMTSQTFYGLSMHWARYCGMFELATKDDIQLPHKSDPLERKTHCWKLWVGKESQLRVLLGLYIIDGVVSQYSGNGFGTPWPTISTLPLPACDAAFNATCPDKWLFSMGNVDGQRSTVRLNDLCYRFLNPQSRGHDDQFTTMLEQELDLFNTKIALEVLYCLATASKRTERPPVGNPSKLEISRALCTIRRHILNNRTLSHTERSIALLRWHSICLDTITSTAHGARRMCYQFGLSQHIFGGLTRQEIGIDPYRWIQGHNARKCLLHSFAIQDIASHMPLGVAQDVYLPGGLFAAATTYSSFALASTLKVTIPSIVDWDVVLLSDFDGYILPTTSAEGDTGSTKCTDLFIQGIFSPLDGDSEVHNLLYDLTSIKTLLRAMSVHWGVTREMEEVIDAWTQRFV